MLESVTAARSFLSVAGNVENAFSAFAVDMGYARRSNALRERVDQSRTCILPKSRVRLFF